MSKTPTSTDLHLSILRLDDAITTAQAEHDAAEVAHRDALASEIATDAMHGENFFPVVGFDTPSPEALTAAAARLASLQKSRDIAQGMLAETRERERLARDEDSRDQLRAVVNLMQSEAPKIDAMYADLAKAIVGFGTLQRQAESILRAQLGINPLPMNISSEIAKSVGAFIAASTSAFPPDYKPVATLHADKFASRSLTDAGAL